MKMHILTIVKDDSQGLQRTINSITSQICSSAEISVLVIDGFSEVSPESIVNISSHVDFTFIRRQPAGIYNAMNEGLKELASTCDIDSCSVVFLNAGDFFVDALAVEKLCRANMVSKISVGKAVMLNQASYPLVMQPEITLGSGEEYMHPIVYWFPHQGLSATFEVYQKVGYFNEKFKIAGDYDWISRAVQAFGEPRIIPDYLVAQMTDGVSNKRSYSGYRERRALANQLNFPLRRLPLLLVIKMYIKEIIHRRLSYFVKQSKKRFNKAIYTHDHLANDICAWCLHDQFSVNTSND